MGEGLSYIVYLLYPLFLFLPSKSVGRDIAKIWFLGLIVTGFFLFMGPFSLPGGGNHFPLYADAIAHGLKLDPHYAQRDVGFPLLLLLTGYTLTGSFIGIALLQARRAKWMSRWCAQRPSTCSIKFSKYTPIPAASRMDTAASQASLAAG